MGFFNNQISELFAPIFRSSIFRLMAYFFAPENMGTLYVVVDDYFVLIYCILPKKCVVKEISLSKWWIRDIYFQIR